MLTVLQLLGEIYGSDSKPLEHNRIQRYLAKSEKLRGKPKLIFIQACQGKNPGTEAMNDRIQDVAADDNRISEYTDFYLSCASVAGDRSYRDIFTGKNLTQSCYDYYALGIITKEQYCQRVRNSKKKKKRTKKKTTVHCCF